MIITTFPDERREVNYSICTESNSMQSKFNTIPLKLYIFTSLNRDKVIFTYDLYH